MPCLAGTSMKAAPMPLEKSQSLPLGLRRAHALGHAEVRDGGGSDNQESCGESQIVPRNWGADALMWWKRRSLAGWRNEEMRNTIDETARIWNARPVSGARILRIGGDAR